MAKLYKMNAGLGYSTRGLLPKKPKANPFRVTLGDGTGETLASIQAGSQKARNTLAAFGVAAPNTKPEPNIIEKILGTVNAPAVGVQSLLHNLVSGPKDKVNPFTEMGKSASGHMNEAMSVNHILTDFGWKPAHDDWFGNAAKFAISMAGEVLTDPTTWVTLGVEGAVKAGATTVAKEMLTKGISLEMVDELAKAGAKSLLSVVDDAGAVVADFAKEGAEHLIDIKKLAPQVQDDVWKAVLRTQAAKVAQEGGNAASKGGIQFVNRINGKRYSIVSDEALQALTPKPIQDIITAGQKYLESVVLSPFSRGARILRNEGRLVKEGTVALMDEYAKAVRAGIGAGVDFGKEMYAALPKEAQHYVGIALERAIKPQYTLELKGVLKNITALEKQADEIGKAIKAGKAAVGADTPVLRALEDAVQRRNAIYGMPVDWDEFAKHLKNLNPSLAEADITRSIDGMQTFVSKMREMLHKQRAVGSTLGDKGARYFAHMDGATPAEIVAKLTQNPDAMGLANPTGIRGVLGNMAAKGSHTRVRKVDELAARIEKGIATNTYAPEVAGKSVAAAESEVARNKFLNDLLEAVGTPAKDLESSVKRGMAEIDHQGVRYAVPESVKAEIDSIVKPLFDDASVNEVRTLWNKVVTGPWRKYATVMNPGFWMRNAQSNFYLAWAQGFGRADSLPLWKQMLFVAHGGAAPDEIIKVFGKPLMHQGKEVTVKEFVELFKKAGAGGGGAMSEISADELLKTQTAATDMIAHPLQSWAKFGQKRNEAVEDWARMTVFAQSLQRHQSTEVAAKMADKVLYNYDPKALTKTEQGLREFFPFMTWMRRNLPQQVETLLKDPSRIGVVGKMQRAGGNEWMDTNKLPDYIRQMVPIPLPMLGLDGNNQMLNPNWGFQDLAKLDPTQVGPEFISMLHPMIKLAFEGATNFDTFRNQPMTAYKGQLTQAPDWFNSIGHVLGGESWFQELVKKAGGRVVDGNILVDPFFAKLLQTNPALVNMGKALTPGPKQMGSISSWLGGIKPITYDDEKFTKQAAYNERQDLRDYIRKMRDEGVMPQVAKAGTSVYDPNKDFSGLLDPGTTGFTKRKKRKPTILEIK